MLTPTAFYCADAQVVAKSAQVLGRHREAEEYAALARGIKDAFNRAFFDAGQQQYEQGTQFSNALPLSLGLVDPPDTAGVLANVLRDLDRRHGRFNVGVVGAKHLIDALTAHGRPDVACQLVLQTGYPSWAHMLEGGRTTLSEFWDLRGSHNHVMMGSVDAWLFRTLAGIQSQEDRPGFEHVVIKPFVPSAVSWVRASTRTIRGPVAVQWSRRAGEFRLQARIPANSTATIFVPASAPDQVRSKPALTPAGFEAGAASFEVGSGHYQFRVPCWR